MRVADDTPKGFRTLPCPTCQGWHGPEETPEGWRHLRLRIEADGTRSVVTEFMRELIGPLACKAAGITPRWLERLPRDEAIAAGAKVEAMIAREAPPAARKGGRRGA